jgi:HEAT repeat protein
MTVEKLKDLILAADEGAVAQAAQLGARALPVLGELLSHKDPNVRNRAVDCAAEIEDAGVPALLAKALDDKSDAVSLNAIRELSEQSRLDLSLLSPLARHVSHRLPGVRQGVALLLGQFDNQAALAPLTRQIGSEVDTGARQCLRLALARLGDVKAKEEIASGLKNTASETRLQTLQDLEYVNDILLSRRLLPLLDDQSQGYEIGDPDLPEYARVCDEAVNLIGKWHGKAVSIEWDDLKVYSDDELETVRRYLKSLGE